MSISNQSRRGFLQKGLLAGAVAFSFPDILSAKGNSSDFNRGQSEMKLGIAGYSFVNFDLEDSLSMMRRMDVRYLCIKDFHLPLDSTAEQISAFHSKLAESNVTGYAVGPIYMKNQAEIDRAFDYCQRVGTDLIIGVPEIKDLPYIAQKAQDLNIRYAIHNHGPEDKIYPNATVIWNHLKDLGENIGICFDMGHNMRDGHDPIKDLLQYRERIFDLHLKNVTSADAEGTTCELGRGVIDIPKFTKTLRKIKYSGYCSLEFEKDMKDPLAGLAESVGYFQGVQSSI
ncbi:MAG: sugar phosphate isomerase/epimerase family protein [Sphingobacterium sp.]